MNTFPISQPTFYNVVLMHELDYPTLQGIAQMAGVDVNIMDAMFTCVAIHRVDALKILAAFSKYMGKPYTFENVRVALHPTLSEIVENHNLNLATLSTESRVSITVIDMMLCDEPVPITDAHLVLEVASHLSGHNYTIENVDVKVTNGDV